MEFIKERKKFWKYGHYSFWTSVLTDLRAPGMEDILPAVADIFNGFI